VTKEGDAERMVTAFQASRQWSRGPGPKFEGRKIKLERGGSDSSLLRGQQCIRGKHVKILHVRILTSKEGGKKNEAKKGADRSKRGQSGNAQRANIPRKEYHNV